MTITIKINTENAAFEDDRDGELTRILTAAIARLTHNGSPYWRTCPLTLHDSNGNTVGSVTVRGK